MQQKRLMYLTFECTISIFNNPPSPLKRTLFPFPEYSVYSLCPLSSHTKIFFLKMTYWGVHSNSSVWTADLQRPLLRFALAAAATPHWAHRNASMGLHMSADVWKNPTWGESTGTWSISERSEKKNQKTPTWSVMCNLTRWPGDKQPPLGEGRAWSCRGQEEAGGVMRLAGMSWMRFQIAWRPAVAAQ